MKKILRKVFVFLFIALLGITLVACKKTFKVSGNTDKIVLVGDSEGINLEKVKDGTELTFEVKEEDGKEVVVKVNGKELKATDGKYKHKVEANTKIEVEYKEKEQLLDKEALKVAITDAKKAQEGITPQDDAPVAKDIEKDKKVVKKADLDALNTAIQAAQKVVDNKEATKEQVEKAVSDLNAAVETFNKAVVVGTKEANKEELEKAILGANEILKENADVEQLDETTIDATLIDKGKKVITKTDYNAFVEAIGKAKAVLEDKDATQDAINKELVVLLSAIQSFTDAIVRGEKISRDSLIKDIENANILKDKAEVVTVLPKPEELVKGKVQVLKEDKEKLEVAIQAAQKVVDNKDATQKEFEEATKKLEEAVNTFKKAVVQGEATTIEFKLDGAEVFDKGLRGAQVVNKDKLLEQFKKRRYNEGDKLEYTVRLFQEGTNLLVQDGFKIEGKDKIIRNGDVIPVYSDLAELVLIPNFVKGLYRKEKDQNLYYIFLLINDSVLEIVEVGNISGNEKAGMMQVKPNEQVEDYKTKLSKAYDVVGIAENATANLKYVEVVDLYVSNNGNIRYIKDNNFNNIETLKQFLVSENIERIGKNVLKNCPNLETEEFEGVNYLKINTTSEHKYLVAVSANDAKEIVLHENTLVVLADAFKGLKTLEAVYLNDELRQIGSDAFAGCAKLVEVLLKNEDEEKLASLVYIESGAFTGTQITKEKLEAVTENCKIAADAI